MYPPFLYFFVFLKIVVCFKNSSVNDNFVPRVVNGWPAKLGDVPYQLAFKQLVSRRIRLYATFCGGVIISPDKVLSAAHCFEEKGSKCMQRGTVSSKHLGRVMAVAGNLYNKAEYGPDSLSDGQWRQLLQMSYPPRYKFPKRDIAVGFTTKPFVINEYVAPIPYTTRFADYKGKCLASGYGRISNKFNRGSDILLLAHLDLIPTSTCSRKHRQNMIKFVCTDTFAADVAKGDSGGPLVCSKTGDPNEGSKGILVGIVSGSRGRKGTFFTRVSSYKNFIQRGNGSLCNPNTVLICFCLINGIRVLFLFCFFLNFFLSHTLKYIETFYEPYV